MSIRPYSAHAHILPANMEQQSYALTEADMVTLRLLQKSVCDECGQGFEVGDLVFQVGADHVVCAYVQSHRTASASGNQMWAIGRVREAGKYYLRFRRR